MVARGALNRAEGQDTLARLGLTSRPYRWAVGARVPVTTTVRAPNDGYATQAGAGQIIAALAVLSGAYLASPARLTAPADHPVRHCLTGLRCQRTAPSPGYPVGGVYTVTAHALLALTVTADNAAYAWDTARRQLEAELDRLLGVSAQPWRMRRTGLRHLTDLDT